MQNKFAYKDSLCWHCSRSTHGSCSWSSMLRPVDGWKATYNKGHETYSVKECPQFEIADKYNELYDIGIKKMSNAVLANAGMDYLRCMEHERRLRNKVRALQTKRTIYNGKWKRIYGYEPFNNEILSLEKFFRSEYAEQFGDSASPIYIMEAIQKRTGIRHESL